MRPALMLAGVLVASTASAQAPDAALAEKGLKKVGQAYVLPVDAEIVRQVAAARRLHGEFSQAARQLQGLDAGKREEKQMLGQMIQERVLVSQQLQQNLSVVEHNRLAAYHNEMADRIELLQQQVTDPAPEKQARARAGKTREDYLQAMLDLRRSVDQANKAYADLAADAGVTKALAEINAATKNKVALGPSRSYLAEVKLFENAEQAIQSESIVLRQENGVNIVEVTLNGRTVVPMVFDTGAGIVCLNADNASKAGLKPGPDDPVIKLTTADGTVNQAKRMTLQSMRVGKFTVQDVECAIMPPAAGAGRDVPPLLGQSFLKNFNYRINPGTNTLTLTRIDDPGSETKAAPKKSATKKGQPKGKGKANGPDTGP